MRLLLPARWVNFALVTACLGVGPIAAQTSTVTIRVQSEGVPLPEVVVRSGTVGSLTDAGGRATLTLLPGARSIVAEKAGYVAATLDLTVSPGRDTVVTFDLELEAQLIEGITISSTRTRADQRIEDEPMRVEVLAEEEIEEKMLMTPGDIGMMLNETSGLRVQSTSPSLGGANVRIQGLRGRYTQILSDGLPLYGGQSGSLSMLQIAPMDLGQVEIIKGAASALYGSSALGGVVNLISRRPGEDREVLLNQTTLGGTDGILWISNALNDRWGYTLLGSVHRQGQADVDDDGWADVPGYRRVVARPRLFWDDGMGRSVFVTAGATVENREGGTREGHLTPGGTEFTEELRTRRADAAVLGRILVGDAGLFSVRGSLVGQLHDHRFGETSEEDFHSTLFAEAAYSTELRGHAVVIGAVLQREAYDARDVSGFDYSYLIPALLAQDEYSPADWLTAAVSGRVEHHSEYGTHFNPRVSLLFRPGDWTARASVGTGYFAPTPFTEETEAVGLSRLLPIADLRVERARTASIDLGRSFGEFELNGTLFGSILKDPIQVLEAGSQLRLVNAEGDTRTSGGELLARWNHEPFHLTATYTHIRSTEDAPDSNARRVVPLTPRNATGLVGMWEEEGVGRVGVEFYLTGRQELDDNPYRDVSRPYVITGLLIERRFGRARLFVNAENLLDTRQTRYDPLTLATRAPSGRWTTDAWAPLEGRAINGGVRYDF